MADILPVGLPQSQGSYAQCFYLEQTSSAPTDVNLPDYARRTYCTFGWCRQHAPLAVF